jgi:tRNA(Ile)-lysidine synthase
MELDRLRHIALQYCGLDPSRPVMVGVSGGPDSLCLLDGLARLGFPLIAAHFDHRLRPESGQEGGVVRGVAASLGVSFVSGSADVARHARTAGLSIEAAAREMRYGFLFEQARLSACQAVAVGHTADDPVGTGLLHLLRGAGLNGLQGMRYRSPASQWDAEIALVRPLLGVWREQTLAYCQERGFQPVFDPSNQNVAYSRNRIRRELIPLLETYQPQVRQNLWRMAEVLAGDEDIIQAAVEEAWKHCLAGQREGYAALRQEEFLALPPGLQRRVLLRAVGDLRDVDFAMVERAITFARHLPGAKVDLIQGLRLFVDRGLLVITRRDLPLDPGWPQIGPGEAPLSIPGEFDLCPEWRLASRWVEPPDLPQFPVEGASPWEAWLDADSLPGALCLRRHRAGDRFQPLGMDGQALKLSDFWINEKLPRRARAGWPLLAAGNGILWVPGFRLAHPYRVQKNTRKALHLRLFRVNEEETLA